MAHPNEELMRKATEALNAGDVETFLDFHTDDAVVHVTGRNRFSGDLKGKQAIMESFGQQAEALDGPPVFELHDVVASDEHGVIIGTNRATRGGTTLESRTTIVLHLQDGKAKELWVVPVDPYAEDEFWA